MGRGWACAPFLPCFDPFHPLPFSLFVYNQLGGIDEAALDRLGLVTEVARVVQGKSGNADAAACGTPSFLWLLRDFYLQLADDAGRPITASDYLEAALAPVPAGTADAGGKNETRRAIRGLFPDRECAALVRPASDEADLQRLDDMDPASLRPEFRAGLDAVSARVFSLARPKRLGATTLTGPALARLTQAYVDALNAGAVPAIATAWAGVAEQECRAAADDAEGAYRGAMPTAAPTDEAGLDAAHERALAAGAAAYAARALGDGAPRFAGDAAWRARAAASHAAAKRELASSIQLACHKALAEAGAALTAYAASPGATPAGLAESLRSFQASYAAGPGGDSGLKWRAYAEFAAGPAAAAAAGLAARSADAAQSDADATRRELDAARRELDAARRAAAEAGARAAAAEAALAGERAAADAARRAVAAAEAPARAVHAEVASLRAALVQAEADAAAARAETAARVAERGAERPAAPAPRRAPAPTPMDDDGAADGGAFQDAGDEPDPSSMTVAAIKRWLTEAGREDAVWRLAAGKAKKAEWVAEMEAAMGRR